MGDVSVDWSSVPRELLELISSHLPSESDQLRFRSICSTWRSSVPAQRPVLSFLFGFPVLPISSACWGFHLSKRTIYLLRSPTGSDFGSGSGWIIKLERDNPARMHLLNPLSTSIYKPLPKCFPTRFDSSRFHVVPLAMEYTLQNLSYLPVASSSRDAGGLYMEKVALRFNEDASSFVLLTIHVSRKLVMFKLGDKKWTVIDDFPSPYDDVICKDGNLYAVDSTGRAVMVDLNPGSAPSVTLVAESIQGGDKKYLVQSCRDLLLVDMYLSGGFLDDDFDYTEVFQFYEDLDCYMSERPVKFKVFKLDNEMHRWEEMSSLGDRIVFLGDNTAFSASASQINFTCKGNCIFFTDQVYSGKDKEEEEKRPGIGVFDMETGSVGRVGDYLGYSDIFWPPPDWIYSTLTMEEVVDQLKI